MTKTFFSFQNLYRLFLLVWLFLIWVMDQMVSVLIDKLSVELWPCLHCLFMLFISCCPCYARHKANFDGVHPCVLMANSGKLCGWAMGRFSLIGNFFNKFILKNFFIFIIFSSFFLSSYFMFFLEILHCLQFRWAIFFNWNCWI